MSKNQQRVTHGYCGGCHTLKEVHQLGDKDPDLHTEQPEAAYLLAYHTNPDGSVCSGFDQAPTSLAYPQGAASTKYHDELDDGPIEITRDGEYVNLGVDDGWEETDPRSS